MYDRTSTERAILGCVIRGSCNLSDLQEDLFENNTCRKIYRVMCGLQKDQAPIEFWTLEEKAKELKLGIRPTEITSLMDGVQGSFDVNFHIKELMGETLAKKRLKVLQGLPKSGDYIEADEKISKMYKARDEAFAKLGEDIEPIDNYTMASHVGELRSFIEKRRESELWGLETPFKELNNALMGLREITVMVAEPKVGKSTFALQIASHVADQGHGIIYYDFENGYINLMIREMCRIKNIHYREELPSKNKDKIAFINGGLKKLEERKNFAIISKRELDESRIRGQIDQMREITRKDDVLIVMDSLQKLPLESLRERRASIDQWLRIIEDLNSDPNLTFLIISEVSRKGDPKESGDIEYTGHFQLRLRKNKEKESNDKLEPKDDMRRNLYVEYARDVEAGKLVAQYTADFNYWKFSEVEARASGF